MPAETREATDDPFVEWLAERTVEVREGSADYFGCEVDAETKLVRYHFALSFVYATVTWQSRYYILGHDPIAIKALLHTAGSLVMGWWCFPWGPIMTIGAVLTNMCGGRRRTVGSLIDELTRNDKELVTVTDAAAELVDRQIHERGFADDTAVLITVERHFQPEFGIQYDLPDSDGRQWRGESNGITVLVFKDDEDLCRGLTVDADGDEFVFRMVEQDGPSTEA